MPIYATKKEPKDAIGVDTSNLAAKKDLIALKAEVKKLDLGKLVNGVSGLNNFQKKSRRFRLRLAIFQCPITFLMV